MIESVAEGAVNAFSAGAIFRNDREVAWLSELFNRPQRRPSPDRLLHHGRFREYRDRPHSGSRPMPALAPPHAPADGPGRDLWRPHVAAYRGRLPLDPNAFQPPPRVAKGEAMGLASSSKTGNGVSTTRTLAPRRRPECATSRGNWSKPRIMSDLRRWSLGGRHSTNPATPNRSRCRGGDRRRGGGERETDPAQPVD